MNTGSTTGTALLRGLYVAIVTGLLAGLTAYQTTDDEKAAIITGAIAALTSLLMRGGVEGLVDAGRQRDGNVLPSDVQPGSSGKA